MRKRGDKSKRPRRNKTTIAGMKLLVDAFFSFSSSSDATTINQFPSRHRQGIILFPLLSPFSLLLQDICDLHSIPAPAVAALALSLSQATGRQLSKTSCFPPSLFVGLGEKEEYVREYR